jgi:uncharacterized membrane protein HdeD (DUF308 family)
MERGPNAKRLRRALIALAYIGIAAIVSGIFLLFINRHNPVVTFDQISETAGAVVLCGGFVMLVASSFIVHRWFRKVKDE